MSSDQRLQTDSSSLKLLSSHTKKRKILSLFVWLTRLFQITSGDERRHRFRIECKCRCVDTIHSFAIVQLFYRHPCGVWLPRIRILSTLSPLFRFHNSISSFVSTATSLGLSSWDFYPILGVFQQSVWCLYDIVGRRCVLFSLVQVRYGVFSRWTLWLLRHNQRFPACSGEQKDFQASSPFDVEETWSLHFELRKAVPLS